MQEKIKLYWASLYWSPVGNAYGYTTHNKMLQEAVERRGDVEFTPEAKVSFTLTTSNAYERIPGKFNFLYTMFETDRLPTSYQQGLQYADSIIVPCEYNKWLFEKYTDLPVDVCSEGVDIDFYQFRRHEYWGNKPFRYLWLAAPNVRKGWEILIAGWKAFHDANLEVTEQQRRQYILSPITPFELYIKTTVSNVYKTDHDGVIFDSRNLSRVDLRDLYYSSNCFVLPTMGEGFGLTLAEAMACGVPCVATSVTGTADFFDTDVGYVIECEPQLREVDITGEKHGVYMPDPNSMIIQMKQCYDDYQTGRAQLMARRAAQRIKEKYTWDISANSLIEILKERSPGNVLYETTVAGDPAPSYTTTATAAIK